jgi:hypothetical protein
MSDNKDWGNNERIRLDKHRKGIKFVTENEHLELWISSGGVDVVPWCKWKHGMNEFRKPY